MIRQKELNFLLKVFFALNAIRNICLFLKMMRIASLMLYASYIIITITIIISILVLLIKQKKVTWYFFLSITLISMLVIIPMLYDLSIWRANSYTPVSFLLTMTFLVVSREINISLSSIRFCYITFIIQGIVALVYSFLPSSFEYGALVLNLGNPNQTAILLWTTFSFCFLYWSERKQRRKQSLGLLFLMTCLVAMIYLTQSRTAILSCIICIGGYFWISRISVNKKIPILFQGGLLTAPIFSPVLILYLMNIFPSGTTIFGKMLFSGRELIWKIILNEFISNPFSHHLDESPYYSNFQDSLKAMKAWGSHNGILAVQWNYGFFVTILVIFVYIYHILDLKRNAEINRNSCMVYIIVLASIVSLSFEEGMLMGNINTTIILPMLFIIGRSERFNSFNLTCKHDEGMSELI